MCVRYFCDLCGKEVDSKGKLCRHKLIDYGYKPSLNVSTEYDFCEECEKKFTKFLEDADN